MYPVEEIFDDLVALKHLNEAHREKGLSSEEASQEIFPLLEQVFSKLGFGFFQFVVMTPLIGNDGTVTDVVYSHHISNFPEEWMEIYLSEGYWEVDPVTLEIEKQSVRQQADYYEQWGALFQTCRDSAKNKEEQIKLEAFITSAADYGLREGIIFFQKDHHSSLLISAACDNVNALNHDMVRMFFQIIVMTLVAIPGGDLHRQSWKKGVIKLTDKNCEILRYFYQHPNASLKQAADAFGISVDSLNDHLKRVRELTNMRGASANHMATLLHKHITPC